MQKPGNGTSWQNTKQTQRQDRAEGRKSVGSGCMGCLGMLCVLGAALYFLAGSIVILLSKGITLIDSILEEAADGGEAVTAASENVFGSYAIVAAIVMAAGLLIVLLPEMIKSRKWKLETEEMAANAQGHWDSSMVEKRRKAARNGRMVGFGLVLLAVPMLLFPVVCFLRVSPVIACVLVIVDVICVVSGLIIVLVGAIMSASGFSQLGKRNDFKAQFVLAELQRIFTDVVYEPTRELSYPLIAETRLIDGGNHYRSNDYISARYRGILFGQADVSIKDISQYESFKDRGSVKTSVILRFQGRWLIFETAKTIQGEFYIFNRQFPISEQARKKGTALEEVVTEDSVFNGAFSIRATNPHDVFYMFTPVLIDKLKGFSGLHNGETVLNGIGLYCRGNRIHVAVSGVKDAFEPGIIETGSEQQIRERLRGEISLITGVIDALA